MKTLAIDTTAIISTAALTEGDKLIGLFTLNTSLTHSETMLPMIESLLKNAKINIDDIDIFACSAGPGSFTGVRIGISIIKGLAFGKNKPCIGVSTLEALSYNLLNYDGIICPIMDAKRSQIYNALFKNGKRLCNDRLITINELSEELANYGETVYFLGDAYDLIENKSMNTPELLKYQNAYSVALCANKYYHENNYGNDVEILPIYLRKSQAERNLQL